MKKIYFLILIILVACSTKKQSSYKPITIASNISFDISEDFSPISEQEFRSLKKIMIQQDIFDEEKLLRSFSKSKDGTTLIISEIQSAKFSDDFSIYKEVLKKQFEHEEIFFGERNINDMEIKQLVISANWKIHRFFVINEARIFKIDFISKNNEKILEEISYSIDSLQKIREEKL